MYIKFLSFTDLFGKKGHLLKWNAVIRPQNRHYSNHGDCLIKIFSNDKTISHLNSVTQIFTNFSMKRQSSTLCILRFRVNSETHKISVGRFPSAQYFGNVYSRR